MHFCGLELYKSRFQVLSVNTAPREFSGGELNEEGQKVVECMRMGCFYSVFKSIRGSGIRRKVSRTKEVHKVTCAIWDE